MPILLILLNIFLGLLMGIFSYQYYRWRKGKRAFYPMIQFGVTVVAAIVMIGYLMSDYYYLGPKFPIFAIIAIVLIWARWYDTQKWLFSSSSMKDEVMILKNDSIVLPLVVIQVVFIFGLAFLADMILSESMNFLGACDFVFSHIFLLAILFAAFPISRDIFDYCYYNNCLKKGMIDQ